MFALKSAVSQRIICCISQNIFRQFKINHDPGIGARKRLKLSIEEDEEDFDDLESDFMEVHKSHKQHLKEMETLKEKTKYHIVKQKYFKEKFPNFLTWHDKEQIRYLHRTDPEEWTIEKLSEGFPALPEVIKKIVKSNWTKLKQHKITNHDKSVQKNWELFKMGHITDLPQDLVEHLNKFTNRSLNFNNFVPTDIKKPTIEVKKNIGSEFSSIITSYNNKKSDHIQIEDKNEIENLTKQPLEETYVASNSFYSKENMITLNQLQDNLKKKIETGNPIDSEEKFMMMNLTPQNVVEKVNVDLEAINQNKYETSSGVQIYKKTERDLSHLNYPEKISIPKAIHKKGFIYKLNDCYYDDDGEFLYRVPGMG